MEKGKLWMIIIIVILALMCAGFVIGFLVLTNTIKSLSAESENQPAVGIVVPILPADIENIAIGESLASNLKTGEDGRDDHLVSLTLQVGLNTKDEKYADIAPIITAKTFAIEDIVTAILRSKTYEELKMDGSDDLLKEEILTRLQEYFQTNVIVQINLKFLLQ